MDEQQSNFKVTDRRLFNADGSPREVPPEERPAPEPQKPEPAAKGEDTPVQPIAASAQETTEETTEDETTRMRPRLNETRTLYPRP